MNSVITLLLKYGCIFGALTVREFIKTVLEFDIGKSWNLRCQNVYEPWITPPSDGSIVNGQYFVTYTQVITVCKDDII